MKKKNWREVLSWQRGVDWKDKFNLQKPYKISFEVTSSQVKRCEKILATLPSVTFLGTEYSGSEANVRSGEVRFFVSFQVKGLIPDLNKLLQKVYRISEDEADEMLFDELT